jgi:hypothetical protein
VAQPLRLTNCSRVPREIEVTDMIPLAQFLLVLATFAQGPGPTPVPPREGPDRRDVPAETARTAPAPDPRVDAFASELVARLGDSNRAIARGAEAGLIALGPQAVPALRKVADQNVGDAAIRARHALEEIRLGPPPFRRRGPDGEGRPNGPPPGPGARDGDGDDRPWPPPFPREGRDRRDGPRGGNDAREGGPPPRDLPPRDDRRDDASRPGATGRDSSRCGADRRDADRDGARRDMDPRDAHDRARHNGAPDEDARREGTQRDSRRRPRDLPPQDRTSPPPRDGARYDT